MHPYRKATPPKPPPGSLPKAFKCQNVWKEIFHTNYHISKTHSLKQKEITILYYLLTSILSSFKFKNLKLEESIKIEKTGYVSCRRPGRELVSFVYKVIWFPYNSYRVFVSGGHGSAFENTMRDWDFSFSGTEVRAKTHIPFLGHTFSCHLAEEQHCLS